MLAQFVKAIKDLFDDKRAGEITEIFKDGPATKKLVVQGHRAVPEIITFTEKTYARNHYFNSIEGFLAYLNSSHCAKDKIIVFVGNDCVSAQLNYCNPHKFDRAVLSLKLSPEIENLNCLVDVTQKTLWRTLLTALAGGFDEELLTLISGLAFSEKYSGDVAINNIGIEGRSSSRETVITFADLGGEGTHEARIKNDWVFQIPLLECFQDKYTIQTVLEVQVNGKQPSFTFHQRNPDAIQRQMRLDLAKHLSDGIENKDVTVHEGVF